MAYGLSDIVQQRRMIDESTGSDAFKRVSIGKLDALVGLAETARLPAQPPARLFRREPCSGGNCGNCDNCLSPPQLRDGKVVAQKLLSCAYRTGQRFGAMHLIDVLVGRLTETRQAIRARQVVGVRHRPRAQRKAMARACCASWWRWAIFSADSEAFGALKLTESARGVLKGETEVMLREAAAGTRVRASRTKSRRGDLRAASPARRQAGDPGLHAALRAWRSEVARKRGVPAYVVLHDSTIDGIAAVAPGDARRTSQHPRHRRQEARALWRRADRAGAATSTVGCGQRGSLGAPLIDVQIAVRIHRKRPSRFRRPIARIAPRAI